MWKEMWGDVSAPGAPPTTGTNRLAWVPPGQANGHTCFSPARETRIWSSFSKFLVLGITRSFLLIH